MRGDNAPDLWPADRKRSPGLRGGARLGAGLIPVVTFYMFYWNTGYEYGLLARRMVAEEQLSRAAFAPRDDEALAPVPATAVAGA